MPMRSPTSTARTTFCPRANSTLGRAPTTSARFFEGAFASERLRRFAYTAQLLPPEMRSCPPKRVTSEQVVRVVVAYIERRPQRMHENFKELALEALRDAWPCR